MLRDYRKEAENPETPADLVEHGKSRALAGMYDVAIQSFRKAIKKQPDYDEAHFGLACSCCAVGEQEEAEAEFRKALELNPVHARAHGELGYLPPRLRPAGRSYRGAAAGGRGRSRDCSRHITGSGWHTCAKTGTMTP